MFRRKIEMFRYRLNFEAEDEENVPPSAWSRWYKSRSDMVTAANHQAYRQMNPSISWFDEQTFQFHTTNSVTNIKLEVEREFRKPDSEW